MILSYQWDMTMEELEPRMNIMYKFMTFGRVQYCARCHKSYLTKGGIAQHLITREVLGEYKDLSFPYCPSAFSALGELNVRVYLKNIFTVKHNTVALKTWTQVWNDIRTHHQQQNGVPALIEPTRVTLLPLHIAH